MVLFIDNSVVQRVLTMPGCIEVQEKAFRGLASGQSVQRPRIDVYVPTERTDGYYRWGTMEGANTEFGVFATRMKSDIVYWPRDDQGNWTEEKYCTRPGRFCGLIFLFSTRNGEPLAIMNDGYLQHMRVGGGAGIGAKHLARQDSHVVGMIGSGGMARSFLRAFCAVRDIRLVRIYSPTAAHREEYAEGMRRELEIEVQPVSDPERAVRGADIISTCTDSMLPVIDAVWLEPGMHVTCVGGAELGEDVYRRADVVVRQGGGGSLKFEGPDRVESGRGHSPVAFVGGTEEEIERLPPATPRWSPSARYPTYVDLATGNAQGRTDDQQISLYLALGNQGLQFASVGWLVYEKARELALGHELPTEWFLQDIRD